MLFTRHARNPLIAPREVKPSRPDFEVIGAFNAGVTRLGDDTILLLRVAERPVQTDPDWLRYPHMDVHGNLGVRAVHRDDPAFDLSDPRLIIHRSAGLIALSTISHLRLARSRDGVIFEAADRPWLHSHPAYECFGIEDARITPINGAYAVNYSAVSPLGISTALVSTRDFIHVERHGIVFPPANRDVTIFPERIGGLYVCYHRPMPGMFGGLNIWVATSPDLIHWGAHRLLAEPQQAGWEAGRIGGGAPPIRTERGWLCIYHAADAQNRYCLGALLTALDDPARILARSPEPVLRPEADYETGGFFPNVVFTCGALVEGDRLRVYYGASDEVTALAEAPLDSILDLLDDASGTAHENR
jgi:predicted GH43/DUF377 family glycosyl hydrolase